MEEELIELITNFEMEFSYIDKEVLEKIFQGYKLQKGINSMKVTIPNDSNIPLNYTINMIKRHLNVSTIVLEINSFKKYEELVKTINTSNLENCNIYVGFSNEDIDINELIEISSSKVKIIHPTINSDNITKVEKHLRNKINNVFTTPLALLRPELLPHDKFLLYIDAIANFIKQNTSNDIQKVMLLDLIFQKNFKYDNKINKQEKKMEDIHNSHFPESFFVNGCGVCNGLSNLGKIILNHPDLNVPTDVIDSNLHSWNSIQIDNKKYFYDFTANIDMFKIIKFNSKVINKIRNMYFIDKNGSKKNTKIIKGILSIYSLTKPFGESFVKKITSSEKIQGIYDETTGEYAPINLNEYYTMDILEVLENYNEIKDLSVDLNNILTNYSDSFSKYNI